MGVDIDEFGNVTICPGLSIGNTRETNLKTIIEGYDYQDFAVIAKLQDKGIKGLMNLASESGYVPREAYVNGCHFCYETRKFLRNIKFTSIHIINVNIKINRDKCKSFNPYDYYSIF